MNRAGMPKVFRMIRGIWAMAASRTGMNEIPPESIVVEGRPYTVAGVMPAGFTLPYDSFIRLTEPVDLYLPLVLDAASAQIRRFHSLRLIGRLTAGAALYLTATAGRVG